MMSPVEAVQAMGQAVQRTFGFFQKYPKRLLVADDVLDAYIDFLVDMPRRFDRGRAYGVEYNGCPILRDSTLEPGTILVAMEPR